MNQRTAQGLTHSVMTVFLLALAFAPSAKAQVSQQFGHKYALCDGIPIYPGSRLFQDPNSLSPYLVQQVASTDPEPIRDWFVQHLPGWGFQGSPPNTYPLYWEFQDPQSSRSVRIELAQYPLGVRYRCF